MATLSIVFHTGFGHTGRAAEAIAAGARSVDGVEVETLEIVDAQIDDDQMWADATILETLNASDGIVFGAPTYMGMASSQFLAFAYAVGERWPENPWQDKIAGGFTAAGFPAGDKNSVIDWLSTFAAQMRMLWVGPAELSSNMTEDGRGVDPNGIYKGVGVTGGELGTQPSEGDLLTAELYGSRLAAVTQRWAG